MDTMMGFAALVIASLVALFSALALDWLLLQGMFLLMRPATANRRAAVMPIEQGTQLTARAYGRVK
jgi:hypothetical protein